MVLANCLALLPLIAHLALPVQAHGNHNQQPMADDPDWATNHMHKEHHISNFDAATFFSMHDFDSDGYWEPTEIKRTYGLDNDGTIYDGSKTDYHARQTPQKAAQVVTEVLSLYDTNEDARISSAEFLEGIKQGKRLPDFGLGPGHHGDDEYEYEIHHYEMFHDENTKEEDLTHPEDIEHFRKHDEREDAEARQGMMDALPVNEQNIPAKFRVS